MEVFNQAGNPLVLFKETLFGQLRKRTVKNIKNCLKSM